MHVHERRRIAVAAVFTLVALPAIWLFDRSTPTASPSVAAAGVAGPQVQNQADVPTTEADKPVFLDNTLAVVAPAVIDVALPNPPKPNETVGTASFQRYLETTIVRPCTAVTAPSGAIITVVNINNGLSTTCTNTLGFSVESNITISLDTDVYSTIADLSDAPIPVRIDW
ncbi:MAG: hypothetical protein RLZZ623_2965 [Actinomycetota bacterium]|jgi:hypothetical protein